MQYLEIEVELFNGEEPLTFPESVADDNFLGALRRAKHKLDNGKANRVVVYISNHKDLLTILEENTTTFNAEKITNKIKELSNHGNNSRTPRTV